MYKIKFRFWEIPSKSFIYDIDKLSKNPSVLISEIFAGTAIIIAQQWVGLEDKNKKEIYVGDRMKIQLPLGGFWGDIKQEKIGVVEYEPEHGGFIVKWEYSRNQHHIEMDCDIAFEGEVIGNIYEK